jgi:hypothetical protein
MSEENNRDDGQSLLLYMNLKSNLLVNISMLRQELWDLWTKDEKKQMEDKRFDGYLLDIASRRDEIISIASQTLSSADFAQFKDITDKSLSLNYHKFSWSKFKKIKRKF